jgi:hypothetical protein
VTIQVDARTLNWRFVLPDEPEGLLLSVLTDEGDGRWLSQLLVAGC